MAIWKQQLKKVTSCKHKLLYSHDALVNTTGAIPLMQTTGYSNTMATHTSTMLFKFTSLEGSDALDGTIAGLVS